MSEREMVTRESVLLNYGLIDECWIVKEEEIKDLTKFNNIPIMLDDEKTIIGWVVQALGYTKSEVIGIIQIYDEYKNFIPDNFQAEVGRMTRIPSGAIECSDLKFKCIIFKSTERKN